MSKRAKQTPRDFKNARRHRHKAKWQKKFLVAKKNRRKQQETEAVRISKWTMSIFRKSRPAPKPHNAAVCPFQRARKAQDIFPRAFAREWQNCN